MCSDLYKKTGSETGEKAIFDLIDYDITDAVIIFPESILNPETVEMIRDRAKAHGKPVICVDGSFDGCVNVLYDYESAFEKVVRHIVEFHGITDTCMIAGGRGNDFSDSRIDVYRKVLEENGVAFDESMIYYGDFWAKPTRLAVETMIEEKKVPRAVICANDVMAIIACEVLKKNGYSIPDDVIVTGFDGIDAAEFSVPKLTTCGCDYGVMAEKVVDLLTLFFEGKQTEDTYKISYDICVSESCGCHDRRDIDASSRIREINDRFYGYQDQERTIYDKSARIMNCANINEVAELFGKCHFYNMCCMVNGDCLDESVDPTVKPDRESFTDPMYLIFDTDAADIPAGTAFGRKDIIPNIDVVMNYGNPLIFTALRFLDTTMGYICCFFPANEDSYCRVLQTANAVNFAISSYRNIRYQQYINKRIEEMYKHDAMTGLYNRRTLYDLLNSDIAEQCASDPDIRLILIIADLDGLKTINDGFGHLEGDSAISEAARALMGSYGNELICSRYGGDEIVAVITAHKDSAESVLQTIIDNVNSRLEEYNQSSGKGYRVAMSLGSKISESSEFNFSEMLEEADKQMYSRKRNKHSRI
ncbi:MAG: diguanylate cyclase [Huintestinicola sp.]